MKEQENKPCYMCKGKGLIKARPQTQERKRCPLCHGSGKR